MFQCYTGDSSATLVHELGGNSVAAVLPVDDMRHDSKLLHDALIRT
jgi:hypothetical protein